MLFKTIITLSLLLQVSAAPILYQIPIKSIQVAQPQARFKSIKPDTPIVKSNVKEETDLNSDREKGYAANLASDWS